MPGYVQAQDNQQPAVEKKDSKEKKSGVLPFHGKLKSVDNTAKTIMVGELTLRITSDTKITKEGKPATLEDGVVGEEVGGAYKKTEDGKLNSTVVHFGPRGDKNRSQKTEKPGGN